MKTKQCPVCDWEIKDGGVKVETGDKTILVCCDDCANEVRADPAKFGEGITSQVARANIAVIQRVYEAFAQRNYAAVLESFASTIEWIAAEHSPLADRSPYRGIDEVRAGVFQRIAAGFDRLIVCVDEIFPAGDTGDKVVALGFYEGARKECGRSFEAQVAHVWTLVAGKVVKFQQFVDTLQLAETAT